MQKPFEARSRQLSVCTGNDLYAPGTQIFSSLSYDRTLLSVKFFPVRAVSQMAEIHFFFDDFIKLALKILVDPVLTGIAAKHCHQLELFISVGFECLRLTVEGLKAACKGAPWRDFAA